MSGEMDDAMKKIAEDLKLGETGRRTVPQLNSDDQGEIKAALTTVSNTIVVNFGKNVAWFAMTKTEAIAFAQLLIERADKLS